MSDEDKDVFFQLAQDAQQAFEEEQRLKDRWVEHVNEVYLADSGRELRRADVYRMAATFLNGTISPRHADTLDLAQELVEAHETWRDYLTMLGAELAIAHPELINELNKPVDPVLWKEFIDRAEEKLRREAEGEDPPANP